MTFSSELKLELCSAPTGSDRDMLGELMGFIRTNATISLDFQSNVSLRFETTAGHIARRLFKIIKSLYNFDGEISVINDEQLRKKNLYQVKVSDDISRYILEDTGYVLGDFGILRPQEDFNILDEADGIAFLRGAFLGAGSMTNPQKSYHLEIVSGTEDSTRSIIDIAATYGIRMKLTERNDYYLAYLKEGDAISDFLSLVGANKAMLDLENVRVYKDVRNTVNRIVNAETSNIAKTVTASAKHTAAIEKIEREVGLDSLPANLREVAIVRLANPNDSLKELGEKLPNPLGKSGVNHRLNKIIEIADSL